jgi:hypothetical protein
MALATRVLIFVLFVDLVVKVRFRLWAAAGGEGRVPDGSKGRSLGRRLVPEVRLHTKTPLPVNT